MRDCDCIASRKTSSANGVPISTSATPIKHQGMLSAFRDQIPTMIAASCASIRDTIIGHDRASFMSMQAPISSVQRLRLHRLKLDRSAAATRSGHRLVKSGICCAFRDLTMPSETYQGIHSAHRYICA